MADHRATQILTWSIPLSQNKHFCLPWASSPMSASPWSAERATPSALSPSTCHCTIEQGARDVDTFPQIHQHRRVTLTYTAIPVVFALSLPIPYKDLGSELQPPSTHLKRLQLHLHLPTLYLNLGPIVLKQISPPSLLDLQPLS